MSGLRVQLRLPKELHTEVCRLARERKVSINALAISALEELCSGKETHVAGELPGRISRIEGKIRQVTLDLETLGELFSLYVYHWFCYTPQLPEAQKTAILLEGRQRHQKFLKMLEKRLQRGELSLGAVMRQSPLDQVLDEDGFDS